MISNAIVSKEAFRFGGKRHHGCCHTTTTVAAGYYNFTSEALNAEL